MHNITVTFKKTAVSGYFYHASSYESETLSLDRNPVAAKKGNRIKLFYSGGDGTDLQVTINGVEEVAEYESGNLYQIHTDDETWEAIVGVKASEKVRRAARLSKVFAARTAAQNWWNARSERDHCIETEWQTNANYRGGEAALWGTNTDLPEWIGPNAKLGLSARKSGGSQQVAYLYNAKNKKQQYTLRVNNVWLSFCPVYGDMQNFAIVTPDEYDAIADYTGGALPDEDPPPRNNYEIRWACQEFGLDYADEVAWRRDFNDVLGTTFGLATSHGQLNLYVDWKERLDKDVARYNGIIEKYNKQIKALEDADATGSTLTRLKGKRSGFVNQRDEKQRGSQTCNERITRLRESYATTLAKHEGLIARLEQWEDGINPDTAPAEGGS